jgi:hypothetical protein
LIRPAPIGPAGFIIVHCGAAASRRLLTSELLTCICLVAGLPSHWGNAADALAQNRGAPVTLLGIGASFPALLYEKWFSEYNKLHPEVQINYQALGSGTGNKQFQPGFKCVPVSRPLARASTAGSTPKRDPMAASESPFRTVYWISPPLSVRARRNSSALAGFAQSNASSMPQRYHLRLAGFRPPGAIVICARRLPKAPSGFSTRLRPRVPDSQPHRVAGRTGTD